MKRSYWLLSMLSLVLAGCQPDEVSKQNTAATSELKAAVSALGDRIPKWYTPEQAARGRLLFQENCVECHGKQGEGAENWQKVGPDGKYPAPPLNGTGHAWHHPLRALKFTVKKGSPGGAGNMPAWEGSLSDIQIVDVLAWIQSTWPDELYQAWAENDAKSRG